MRDIFFSDLAYWVGWFILILEIKSSIQFKLMRIFSATWNDGKFLLLRLTKSNECPTLIITMGVYADLSYINMQLRLRHHVWFKCKERELQSVSTISGRVIFFFPLFSLVFDLSGPPGLLGAGCPPTRHRCRQLWRGTVHMRDIFVSNLAYWIG
jgi:hypothetical protein